MTAEPVRLTAPAKLTLSLRVTGRHPDGMHELDAEMVTLDLADDLDLVPGGDGVGVVDAAGRSVSGIPSGPENLAGRALALVGRRAGIEITKRIPRGGGLGGGSADAAAVLRWAGWSDLASACRLGSDVPFCVLGGRARVRGIGEVVQPLEHRPGSFLLLLPPFGVDTAAAYRAFDELTAADRVDGRPEHRNDLTAAALAVEPRLGRWRDALARVTGTPPVLAGSGSTWFVPDPEPGALATLPEDDRGRYLEVDGRRGRLHVVATVPAGWERPGGRAAREPFEREPL